MRIRLPAGCLRKCGVSPHSVQPAALASVPYGIVLVRVRVLSATQRALVRTGFDFNREAAPEALKARVGGLVDWLGVVENVTWQDLR